MRRILLILLLLNTPFLESCLGERVVRCRDGLLCPDGTACDDAHRGCVLPEQLERCDGKLDGDNCSYRGTRDGACYEGVCLPAGCGNGISDKGEVCDDGNRVHGDGCSADCRSKEQCGNGVVDVTKGESCEPPGTEFCRPDCVTTRCGDGVVDEGDLEACDLGAANARTPDAACRPNCQPRRCGDGVQDSDEVCDDGNNLVGDGCSSDCKSTEQCGNGVVDVAAGESCEPPGTDFCRADCVTMRCGDGTLDEDAFEQCDDGSQNSREPDAACRPNCQARRCGDGIKDSGEACDDGNQRNGDGCSYDCLSDETCGNGYRDIDEECDDAGFLNHDGCSSLCLVERPTDHRPDYSAALTTGSHDAARGRFVCADGYGTSEFSGQWMKVADASFGSVTPASNGEHGQAWDSRRMRTVLFGGRAQGLTLLDQTWEWNGATWLRMQPQTKPPARAEPAMAFDAVRGRVVMFGGATEESSLADTWEWNGREWTPTAPSQAPNPGAWTIAFDPRRGQVAVMDGAALWWWTGSEWERDAFQPPLETLPGERPVLGFDPQQGYLQLFFPRSRASGEAASFWELTERGWAARGLTAPASDLWTGVQLFAAAPENALTLRAGARIWRLRSDTWSAVADKLYLSIPEEEGALAYDPVTGTTIMAGRGKTWRWGGGAWMEITDANAPPVFGGQDLTFDVGRREFVMTGGFTRDGSGADSLFDGTFTFDGKRWTTQELSLAPSLRTGPCLAYDIHRRRTVLFGGVSRLWPASHETWTWQEGRWNLLDLESWPIERVHCSASYDPNQEHVVVVGGLFDTEPYPLADLWTLTDSWTRHSQVGPTSRMLHALTYDPNRRSFYAFGGFPGESWEMHLNDDGSYGEWGSISGTLLSFGGNGRIATYDAVQRRTLIHIANRDAAFSYSAPAQPDEACRFGFDTDGDSLIGCDDPDCWPFCTPLCPPGAPCDLTYPHCGDGECNEALETCRMCPEDCGACPALCGDFFCDAPETMSTCPGDCTPP